MHTPFSKTGIMENLELLSDWLQARHTGEQFELLLIGGAALALMGNKDQTNDIDVLKPHPLPGPLQEGIRAVAKAKRLAPGWLNDQAAQVFSAGPFPESKRFPEYFGEVSRTFMIGKNLQVHIIGRQALISLKLYACNPSVRKHIDDLKALRPTRKELEIAVEFYLAQDPHVTAREDLAAVISELEINPDEVIPEH